MDNIQELETKPMGKLLWQYALPTVVSQVVTSIYNIVDRVFLGNSVGDGKMLLAALTITFPLMNIIHAFGSLVGAGSSARMSIVLGRKDIRWAEKILGNSVLLTFLFGFIFVVGGYLWMNPILNLFADGASKSVIDAAAEYMYIVLPGMFLVTLTFNLTGLIRSSGYPMKGMWIMAGGALLNILLDYVFINLMGWGIHGAAWATTISMAASSAVAVAHFMLPGSFIRFKRHCWQPKMYIFRNILAIGISPFSMNVAAFAVVAVLNRQLIRFGGDDAMTVYGAVNSAAGLVLMVMLGLCQAMQPIAGYNYGARRNDRLKEVYLLTMKVCLLIGVTGSALSMLFPRTIIGFFNSEPEILTMGVPALRYLMVMCPLIAFTVTNSQLFQSIDQPWIAIVTSLSRQVIFLIPLAIVLPGWLMDFNHGDGVTGVWQACMVCDVLGAALSAVLLATHFKVFSMDYVPKERRPRKERGPKEK